MKSVHGSGEESRYLLRVQGIFPPQNADDQQDEGKLLATQYSFLCRSPFFTPEEDSERDPELDDKELLLHFKNFDCMGERHDATLIPIKDITDAKPVEINLLGPFGTLQYIVDLPEGTVFWLLFSA